MTDQPSNTTEDPVDVGVGCADNADNKTVEHELNESHRTSLKDAVQNMVITTTTRMQGAFEDARMRLIEFDTKNCLSQNASEFMGPHLTAAQEAMARIGDVTKTLQTSAEVPVSAMTRALAGGSATVNELLSQASEYDKKFKLSVGNSVTAMLRDTKISEYLATTATAFSQVCFHWSASIWCSASLVPMLKRTHLRLTLPSFAIIPLVGLNVDKFPPFLLHVRAVTVAL